MTAKPLILCLLAALAVPAWSQFAPVAGASYTERAKPKLAISGDTLVGLSANQSQRPSGRLYLWIKPKSDFDGELRITTVTDSGDYDGTGRFVGRAPANAWTNVAVLNAKGPAAQIRNRRADPMFATLAQTGRGSARQLILSAWTSTPAPPLDQFVSIAVNDPHKSVQLVLADGRKKPCQSTLGRGSRAAFNTICQINRSDFDRLRTINLEMPVSGGEVNRISRRLL